LGAAASLREQINIPMARKSASNMTASWPPARQPGRKSVRGAVAEGAR